MERNGIEKRYKWDLSPIVNDDAEWEKIFAEAEASESVLTGFRGKLRDAEQILKCLRTESAVSEKLSRLYVFAKMRWDEDARDPKFKAMTSRAETLSVRLASATAYIEPEILENDTDFIYSLAKKAEFSDFSYKLSELARGKKHILSEKEEIILSETGAFAENFHTAFSMYDNADVKFAPVEDENGVETEMSHGVYSKFMQSGDRRVRRDAYRSMASAYRDYINVISEIYAGNVKKDNFYAKIRGYSSALEHAVDSENVSVKVYENLAEAVNSRLDLLHDYMGYRKSVLGYDRLEPYDLHMSLFSGEEISVGYDDACKIVKEALAPLGAEYAELLDTAFESRWIDVYETKGKRSGAYSWGSYNAHPYVLLNYQPTTHDVFTIAHELGHAMHSYYSNKAQCFEKAGYEIFVAEVASTVNEILLLKYLVSKSSGETRKYFLSYELDMFRTTLFRQTQFAEFEEKAHAAASGGESLTPEFLSDLYLGLNKKYYGKELENDPLIGCEWARIPHFYNAFYVYKYATGIASAVRIADRILNEGKPALDDYKKFLSAGGSTDPVSILKYAGVDLERKETLDSAFSEFESVLAELKAL